MRAVLGLLLMSFAVAAMAQVTFDSAGDGESPNRLKYPITVGTGSNRALAVFVHLGSNCGQPDPTIGSVTFGGVALVRVFAHPHTGCTGSLSELWALPPGTQPASGTGDVELMLVGNLTSRRTVHSGAISAAGVDQTTTFTTTGANDGTGTTASLTLGASGANDLVFDSACGNATGGFTGTAQTQRWLRNVTGFYSCDNSGGATAVGGTTALSWSQATGQWVVLGAAFKAAPAQTVTLDAVNSSSGGYALAYPLTVGSGSNRALGVFTHIGTACGFAQPNVIGVSYAGVPLISILNRAVPACLETNSALWALPPGTEPSSGTHDVVVTLGGTMTTTGTLHSGAISAAGVDQATTFNSVAATDGYSPDASVTLSLSAPEDLVIDSLCTGSSVASVGAGQAQRWRRNLTGQLTCDNSAGATADGGQTYLRWGVVNDYWVLLAASFRASAAGAGPSDGGLTDGGTDGGVSDGGGPLNLSVECGCGSGNGTVAAALALALAGATLANGRRRHSQRAPSAAA